MDSRAFAGGFHHFPPLANIADRSFLPEAVDRYLGTVVARETPFLQRLRAETSRLPETGIADRIELHLKPVQETLSELMRKGAAGRLTGTTFG